MNETERERREPDTESRAARRVAITRTAREESSPCMATHWTAAWRRAIHWPAIGWAHFGARGFRGARRRGNRAARAIWLGAAIAVAATVAWNARPVREIRERTAWNMGRNGATLRTALAAALQGVGKTSAEVLHGAAK